MTRWVRAVIWVLMGVLLFEGRVYGAEEIVGELSFEKIEESMEEIFGDKEEGSFQDLVLKLIKGEMSFDLSEIGRWIWQRCFGELNGQKKAAVQILMLTIVAAIFSNYTNVFERSQTAEVSFYLVYLILIMLLLRAFGEMEAIAVDAVNQVASFLKALLPVYLMALAFANGSFTAVGFSQLTIVMITVLQWLLKTVVLPGIHLYVILSVLNQIDQQDRFSKFTRLIRMVLAWILKTATAAVIGVQTVQCLVMPAVDALKTSLFHKAAGALPGVGNVFNSVTEVVLGSAVLVKNAVGAAGIIVLSLICLIPLVKIAICVVLYRFLAAITQPVSDRRLTLCVESVGDGAELLMKVLTATGLMFFVSLALVTSFVRGG